MTASLKSSAEMVAAPWLESTFYADAEQWAFIFWNAGTPFRRLFDQLDLTDVLELSSGHGRHSEKVAALAGKLTLVDIFDENLNVCRARLQAFENVTFHRINGYDLRPVPDRSISALFCYDSMVHFSPDLVASYLLDTARVLKPGGRALFHHSNYDAPDDRHYGLNPCARNHMTESLFRQYVSDAGLTVLSSETTDWSGVPDIDRLTLVELTA